MTEFYNEDQAIVAIARLTRARLTCFVQADVIRPAQSAEGPVYRRADIARMELLCDLCDDFNVCDEALGVVMSLLDQLHGARGDLLALLRALKDEPEEVRARVMGRIGG